MTDQKGIHEHYFVEHPESEAQLGLIQTCLRNFHFEFLTASSVFSRKHIDTGTRLLIEAMILPSSGCVLDIGCGYGAVGIAAATFNPALQVKMTDVNSRAVYLARKNIERNKTINAEARCGYLYTPVKNLTFNCVLSNPPVSAGMNTVKAIITEAPRVMAEKAKLQMVVRSKIGRKILPIVFNATFGNCEVVARESGYRVLTAEKETSVT